MSNMSIFINFLVQHEVYNSGISMKLTRSLWFISAMTLNSRECFTPLGGQREQIWVFTL